MPLQRRLGVALLAVILTALLGAVATVVVHRQHLVREVDSGLLALAANPRVVIGLAQRGPSQGVPEVLSEVYVGRINSNRRLVTLLTPSSDPDLEPRTGTLPQPGDAVGRDTASGASARVRLVTAELANGSTLVLAQPTTRLDASVRRLAITLAVALGALVGVVVLLVGWVRRDGLTPILAMTAAADDVAAGRPGVRIPEAAPGTEAYRLGAALNTMLDSQRASEERMQRFVADASHELRTPLTTLRGYSSLHAPTAPEPVAEALRRIHAETVRMGRLVDDLVQLADLDRRSLDYAATDLAEIVRDVAADLSVIAPERDVDVIADATCPAVVDGERVRQALRALATNAVRHTPPEAVITIAVAPNTAKGIDLTVQDTGPGIPAAEQARVFDRFAKGTRSGGTGLGLAIVAAIARAHGGSCGMVSPLPGGGSGTIFTLSVPIAPPAHSLAGAAL